MNELFYIPFLKLKQNEVMALKELEPEIKENIIPFFDFPRDQNEDNSRDMTTAIHRVAKQLQKHFGEGKTLYIDTYDIDDQEINGIHSYLYLLKALNNMDSIPVIGIDRTPEHKQSIITNLKHSNKPENTIAFRITFEDFASFHAIKDEIDEALDGLLNDLFTHIDLIMDCRTVHNLNKDEVKHTINNIKNFIRQFTQAYPVRKIIVTGSSIPVMLNEICSTHSHNIIDRQEIEIHQKVAAYFDDENNPILFGDYSVVSPEFTQPNEHAKRNGASKLIYAHEQKHYIWRGGKVIPDGFHQYREHIEVLLNLNPAIFRGKDYSWGDCELEEKYKTKQNFTQSTIVKSLVNAHINYMSHTYSR